MLCPLHSSRSFVLPFSLEHDSSSEGQCWEPMRKLNLVTHRDPWDSSDGELGCEGGSPSVFAGQLLPPPQSL